MGRSLLLLLAFFTTIATAEPLLEKADAFPANTNGIARFRILGIEVTQQGTDLAYSDLAVLPDGTVLCLWETKNDIQCARFNLDWITTP